MLHRNCLVLGASRGLGKNLLEGFEGHSTGVSRTMNESIDFSKEDSPQKVLKLIERTESDLLIYCAGGGPHGSYFEKRSQSHRWAFQVNSFTPLEILKNLEQSSIKTFIYIGSAIAERSVSSQSLSYSHSKKLTKRAFLDYKSESLEALVFSPPFMDTDLLPPGAWPRTNCPDLVLDPHVVAQELFKWIQDRDSDERYFDWIERFAYTIPEELKGLL